MLLYSLIQMRFKNSLFMEYNESFQEPMKTMKVLPYPFLAALVKKE